MNYFKIPLHFTNYLIAEIALKTVNFYWYEKSSCRAY